MELYKIRATNLSLVVKNMFSGSQKGCAEAIDKQANMVSEWVNSKRNMGERVAREIEEKLNLPMGWLDSTEHEGSSNASSVEGSSIIPWEEEDDLPKDEFVFIPRLSINGSCGNGALNWHIEEKGQRQAFRRSWVNSIGINPKNCATIQAVGDSMTPRIQNSDSLVIDLADTQVRDGRVYAVAWADEMLIKRIFKLHDGSLRFVSDNKDYEPRDVPAHDLELVRIVGRVVAVSGAM